MSQFNEDRRETTCQLRLKHSSPRFTWMLNPAQLIDGSILAGHWEPCSTWVCETLVQPGMTCLDVGANIGYYTVLLGHLAGPSGLVVAFEPMCAPAQLISTHCRLNGMAERCLVRQVALSSENSVEDLFFNYSWPPDQADATPERVPVLTLDEVMRVEERLRGRQVDFIKIDVDGYEMRVLKGASGTLREHKPLILLEVCEYTLRQTDVKPRTEYQYGDCVTEMLTYLRGLGYRFYFEEDFSEATATAAVLQRRDLSQSSINLICDPRVK